MGIIEHHGLVLHRLTGVLDPHAKPERGHNEDALIL